jgi:hypothetical protein
MNPFAYSQIHSVQFFERERESGNLENEEQRWEDKNCESKVDPAHSGLFCAGLSLQTKHGVRFSGVHGLPEEFGHCASKE